MEIFNLMSKKIVCSIFCLLFFISMAMPVFASPKVNPEQLISYLDKPEKPGKPPKPDPSIKTNVDIRNIPSGETIYSTVLIITEVEGTSVVEVF